MTLHILRHQRRVIAHDLLFLAACYLPLATAKRMIVSQYRFSHLMHKHPADTTSPCNRYIRFPITWFG